MFTNGVFDLLHPGHLALLAIAPPWATSLMVAINDDASVARLKGPSRPMYPAAERAEILLALRWVDAVTVFAEDTPLVAIERARARTCWSRAPNTARGGSSARNSCWPRRPALVRYPMATGYSTTDIVRRMT